MPTVNYTTPGTYTFTVVAYTTLSVDVSAPGGGSSYDRVTNGSSGGNSSFGSSSAVVAYGGTGNTRTGQPAAQGGFGGAVTVGGGGAGSSSVSSGGGSFYWGSAGGRVTQTWAPSDGGAPAASANITVVVGQAGTDAGDGVTAGTGYVSITYTASLVATPLSTSLLLHFDGPYAPDSAGRHAVNLQSGATLTSARSKIGSGSLSCDGTAASYVVTDGNAPHSDFGFALDDFTIETWIWVNSFRNVGYDGGIYDGRNAGDANNPYLGFYWNGSAEVVQYYTQQGAHTITTTTPIPVNQWVHVALVRYLQVSRVYVNGVSEGGTFSDTYSYTNTYATINYGPCANCYIDEYRISRGARYTANFTPSVAPFPPYYFVPLALAPSADGTVLLLHLDGANGSTAYPDATARHVVNPGGSGGALSTALSKFGPSSFHSATQSGMLVNDASADFLFDTNNFTIDLWFYLTALPSVVGGDFVLYWPYLTGSEANVSIAVTAGGNFLYSTNRIVGATAVTTNVWHHAALVRSGGTLTLYLDGVSQGSIADTSNYGQVGSTNYPLFLTYGYLDEVRVTKGRALWTGNFTPPTAPYTPTPMVGTAALGLPGLTTVDGNTVLLLHCEGTQFATTFTDYSGKNHAVTSNGGTRVNNNTGAARFGGGGAEFGGTTAFYLSLDSGVDFAFGLGDFTIEAWVNLVGLPSTTGATFIIYDSRDAGATVAPFVVIDGPTNKFQFGYDGAIPITGTTVATTGVWYHVAAVRAAGVTKLYVNGVQEGPIYADPNNYAVGAGGYPRIGASGPAYSPGCFNGFMDEIRVSRVARWTTNFSPPTAPYPPYQFFAQPLAPASPVLGNAWPLQSIDAATVLLLHCDGFNGSTVVPDTSGRNHPVTQNGNAKLATAQERFGSSSLSNDGTIGSYLTLDGSNDFAFGTGDFTVDLWFFPNASGTNQTIYDSRPNSVNGLYPVIYFSGSTINFYQNSLNVIAGVTTLTIGAWYHVALVRAAGVTKLYLNGVQEGPSYTDTNNYLVGASAPVISGNAFTSTGNTVNGYLDEIRVTKGVARWTNNFSPPNAPYGYLFYGTPLAPSSPAFGTPGLGGSMAALDLVTSSPVFTAPALTHFYAIPHAIDLVTGSPYLGLGYSIGVLRANNLVTGSPVVPVDPTLQQHPQILYGDDLVPDSPVLGKPGRIPSPPPTYPADMDRHVRRSGDDYAQALIDLLPRGQAWPRDPGSTMIQALTGLAMFYGYVDGRAADLLETESDPRATLELLPDWERNWGLPDPCFQETTTIGERRDILVMKMTMLGGQSRDFFFSVAEFMGYSIFIEEYSPFMVGISQCGDTSALSQDRKSPRWQIGRPEMRFYWTIHVTNASLNWFRASQGQAGVDPHLRIGLFLDQNCLFNRWKPAHTEIVYSYSNLQPGHSMDGTP
jgi:uncharacterized protein YmfQ (DUF2313 family)